MPASEHKFSVEELIAALIRDQGIHEGWWALSVEFNATGTSVRMQADSNKTLPGVIVSVASATLVRAENAPGAVDAAVVNPSAARAARQSRNVKKPHNETLQ